MNTQDIQVGHVVKVIAPNGKPGRQTYNVMKVTPTGVLLARTDTGSGWFVTADRVVLTWQGGPINDVHG